MKIYTPDYNGKVDENIPMIFLAGPIVNSFDWQSYAIQIFTELNINDKKNFNIANPRLETNLFDQLNQVNWESRFLKYAGNNGMILFWLSKRDDTPPSNRSYARTSRFELAEWIVKSSFNDFKNIAIGMDERFDGMEYIKIRLNDYNYPHNVPTNLRYLIKQVYNRL